MDYWEFLLQREGDQSWLPLETAQAEILEGRYRIMAHSSRVQVPVEIRISQFLLEEMPPRRRVLKRQAYTNEDGLLVVMPFRWLQPGYWEVRCIGGDAMSDLLGESWQHGVQLRVLSQTAEAELWDDGDEGSWVPQTDSIPAPSTPSLSQPEAGDRVESSDSPAPSEPPQPADDALDLAAAEDQPEDSAEQSRPADDAAQALTADLTRQVFDVMFADLDASLAPVPESPEAAIAPTQDLNLCRIDLDQQALMRQPQKPLVLSGAIAAAPTADPSLMEAVLESLPPCQLRVRLRDPQTLALLGESLHSVAPGAFPVPFQLQIQLPEHLRTRLVLGEVALQAPAPAATTDSWGRASFTITAAMNELLEALANQSALDFAEDYALVPSAPQPDPALSDSAELPTPTGAAAPADESETPDSEKPDSGFPYSFTVEARPAEAVSHPTIDLPPAKPTPDPFGPPLDLFLPSSGRVMPPQIYRPDPGERQNFSPSLPSLPVAPALPDWESTLPTVEPPTEPSESSEPPESPESPESSDDLIATAPEEPAPPPQTTALQDDQDAAVAAAVLQGFLQEEAEAVPNPWDLPETAPEPAAFSPEAAEASQPEAAEAVNDAAETAPPPVESPASAEAEARSEDAASVPDLQPADRSSAELTPEEPEVDQAFQSLNLQNRFWTRLSTLATEDHAAAAAYNAALAAAEVSRTAPAEPEPEPEPAPEPSPFTSRLEDEVVIYDDPEPEEAESAPAADLDDDLPVPTPTLIVPEGELVSGDGMTITITLPHYPSRMGVKLWISDPQTRTLLAEPRWLMDFSPDGTGQLESTIRLQVPFGCLQMTIGAIATDLVRQREGYKVSVQRTVIPPNLPPLSLDEFEI